MLKRVLLPAILLLSFLAPAHAADPVDVVIETSKGDITLRLDTEKAPKTVANFLRYVDEGFYDGTIFHRVIPGFMIQGGGLTPDLVKKPTHSPVENEAKNGLKNLRGSIAMARTRDPHSATSQFFINHRDNPNLDYPSFDGWGYAVFGKVVDGMDVVDAIAQVPTTRRNGRADVPVEPVIIKKVRRK
jgi:peptidyl-prolyl cis-trans isomerase A (cyclophilin A)